MLLIGGKKQKKAKLATPQPQSRHSHWISPRMLHYIELLRLQDFQNT